LCEVQGLSSGTSMATVSSTSLSLAVSAETADTSIFWRWTPNPAYPNPLNESGQERFARMRHLGYC
jgi:hypothetical protein